MFNHSSFTHYSLSPSSSPGNINKQAISPYSQRQKQDSKARSHSIAAPMKTLMTTQQTGGSLGVTPGTSFEEILGTLAGGCGMDKADN